jgi:hypothetical protein
MFIKRKIHNTVLLKVVPFDNITLTEVMWFLLYVLN